MGYISSEYWCTDACPSVSSPAKNDATGMVNLLLVRPPKEYRSLGRHKYDGTMMTPDGPVPIVAKLSHPDEESNDKVIRESQVYYRLRELWGTVIPKLYAAGRHQIDDQDFGQYSIVVERVDKVESWNAETKMLVKQAIQELHRLGIVHRGIHLVNVNFGWRRDTRRVVITDLGHAREGSAEEMEEELKKVDAIETPDMYGCNRL